MPENKRRDNYINLVKKVQIKSMHRFFSDLEQNFWKFDCSTKVIFADHLADKIVSIVDKFGQRVGIVTDNGVSQLNYYRCIKKSLEKFVQTECSIRYESDLESITKAIKQITQAKVDIIMAVGGGSVLDAAKIIRTSICSNSHPCHLMDLSDNFSNHIKLLTVPTTFGTGSEVNFYAHVSDRRKNKKKAMKRGFLSPDLALIDARVTQETPKNKKQLFAVDAFVHALEAYTLKRERSPLQEMILEKSIQLMLENYKDYLNNNLQAAKKICLASVLAGYGLNNARTGLIHTLAAPFANTYHLPHALSLLPFIKPVFHFNRDHLREDFFSSEKIDDFISCDLIKLLRKDIRRHAPDDGWIEDLCRAAIADKIIFKENPAPLNVQDIKTLYHFVWNSLWQD